MISVMQSKNDVTSFQIKPAIKVNPTSELTLPIDVILLYCKYCIRILQYFLVELKQDYAQGRQCVSQLPSEAYRDLLVGLGHQAFKTPQIFYFVNEFNVVLLTCESNVYEAPLLRNKTGKL